MIHVYDTEPQGFHGHIQVAACYIEIDSKLLLLQKSSGEWTFPAGKVEQGETPFDGAIRELREETGIEVNPTQVEPLKPCYITRPDIHYTYHPFRVHLEQVPKIVLSEEHQAFRWATLEECLELPLVTGGIEVLCKYKKP